MKGSVAPIRNVGRGKKPWMLDLRYLGGKREFFETKGEAETVREKRLDEKERFGTSSLAVTPDDRMELIRAKPRLEALGISLSQAIDFYEQHHRKLERISLRKAVDELYRLKLDANKRERSATNFYYTCRQFAAAQPETMMVSEVTRAHVEEWLYPKEPRPEPWAPSTIRTKLIDLQTFFRAAIARGWATQMPTDGIERVEMDDKPPGILTVEQCERLLTAARDKSPEMCGIIALELFCGIRPEEVQKMQPADVQIERGFAVVRAEVSKTRQRRLVDLSANAREWLAIGLTLPPVNLRNRMNAVRVAAGFSGFRKKMEEGHLRWFTVEGDEWPHDCLRHSFASYHLAMHGSADKTATQMGHRSTEMLFRHYRELVAKQEAERFWGIRP